MKLSEHRRLWRRLYLSAVDTFGFGTIETYNNPITWKRCIRGSIRVRYTRRRVRASLLLLRITTAQLAFDDLYPLRKEPPPCPAS